MFKKYSTIALCTVITMGLTFTPKASFSEDDGIIAKINSSDKKFEIRTKDLNMLLDQIGAGLKFEDFSDQTKRVMLNQHIGQKLLANAAKNLKLEEDEKVKRDIEAATEEVIKKHYIAKLIKEASTEKRLKQHYKEKYEALKGKEQVSASHILVKDESEANDIAKKLKNGAEFAVLAKQKSVGPSASKGGKLGWFNFGDMVTSFAETAFALEKVGQISKPVQTRFGWHVIKLDGKREAPIPSFEEAKNSLKKSVASKIVEEKIKELKKDSKIEYIGDYKAVME